MTNPDLSIIIPHHDIPDLLVRCLKSIPNRNNVEIIVIDDNSQNADKYLDEYDELSRPDVQFIKTTTGRGAGYARNIGLELAKGKWLLFADSDDFFVEDFYDVVSCYFDSSYDMVLFKAESVDNETLQPTVRNENINLRIDQALSGEYDARAVALRVHSPWCRLIRRGFIEENAIRFDEVKASNDTMFSTKATCLAHLIGFSDTPIYVVTQRPGSLWDLRKSNPENYLTRLKVFIERNHYVKQFGYRQTFILKIVFAALGISASLFVRALVISIKNGGLFQGMGDYIEEKYQRHDIKKA